MNIENAMTDFSADPYAKMGARGFPLLPGGVGRSTYYTGRPSRYVVKGQGCYMWDDQGRQLIDVNNNFTTLIHGNAHPELTEAASKAMHDGACWGVPNTYEWEHAELLLKRLPSLDQIRFTNSGSEAVMTAVRIARAATGRDGCLMVKAAYHGSSDIALCAGGPKYTRGVPQSVINDVALVPLNETKALAEAIEARPAFFAAIVIDLLPNRAGLDTTTEEFLALARKLATKYGIALIIDEVISFRLGGNGFAAEYGVEPDLLTTGKLIGGGFPVGAVVGKEELMQELDPRRADVIPHAGTFSGNPVSMAAGAASLRLLTPEAISKLNAQGDAAREKLAAAIEGAGWEVRGYGSLLRPFPRGVRMVDANTQSALWWAAYERDVVLSSANMAALSTVMNDSVVNDVVERLAEAVLSIAK